MDIPSEVAEAFRNIFIEDSTNEDCPECGCYLKNPQYLGLTYSKAMVPLKHINYEFEIVNGLLLIHLCQTYENPTEHFLNVEYSFPIDEKTCVYNFLTRFGDVVI